MLLMLCPFFEDKPTMLLTKLRIPNGSIQLLQGLILVASGPPGSG